jgi:hypothetical protein
LEAGIGGIGARYGRRCGLKDSTVEGIHAQCQQMNETGMKLIQGEPKNASPAMQVVEFREKHPLKPD